MSSVHCWNFHHSSCLHVRWLLTNSLLGLSKMQPSFMQENRRKSASVWLFLLCRLHVLYCSCKRTKGKVHLPDCPCFVDYMYCKMSKLHSVADVLLAVLLLCQILCIAVLIKIVTKTAGVLVLECWRHVILNGFAEERSQTVLCLFYHLAVASRKAMILLVSGGISLIYRGVWGTIAPLLQIYTMQQKRMSECYNMELTAYHCYKQLSHSGWYLSD